MQSPEIIYQRHRHNAELAGQIPPPVFYRRHLQHQRISHHNGNIFIKTNRIFTAVSETYQGTLNTNVAEPKNGPVFISLKGTFFFIGTKVNVSL
ncbi:hypothetical protein V6D94_15965, partial [Serratia marcescens]|uniref:hypothetical protein n=1 Tax=Serratia marcescens TaxID=615 RepID=UPI002FDA7AF0